MHHRLSLWMALFAFAALGAMRAQSPATPPTAAAPAAMVPGQIKAMQVNGSVSMVLNGTTTPLHDNDAVSQAATIITQNDSSVVLVFSNGATTQLGGDTTLSIDQFLQDPITAPVNIGALTTEPTHSKTKLHLSKGELLGKVAHLKIDEGSSFTVETPVGAAGIRGTTFRIVFRPTGTGQAFAMFSLSTVEGNVNFQQPGANGPTAPQPGQPQGPTPGPGNAPATGVAVTGGQEVVVTVSVNVNAQTGQIQVTAPIQVASTTPINPVTEAALVSQATNLATAASAATFTPAPANTPATSGGTTDSTGTTQQEKKQDDKKGDTSGGGTGGGNSTGTPSGGGTDSGTVGANPPSQTSNAFGASPPPTNNPLPVDPATGQPTH